ncbi:MAG: OadG family protein, partial [Anaerovoracaceae bacterium]
MSVMELFADPSTMHQLSMGDKLIGAGMTTVMGMGMTFIILLLLWGCIALMNKIIATVTKKPKATDAAPAVKPAAAPAPAVAPQ